MHSVLWTICLHARCNWAYAWWLVMWLHKGEKEPKNVENYRLFNLLRTKKSISIASSNWQQRFFNFYHKAVKLDVLCTQNKVWIFGTPF